MFYVNLAELNILIDNKFPFVEEMCRDYIVPECRADFSVSVTEEEILADENDSGLDMGYLESLAIYRKIAEKLTSYNGFLMHGVVIETNNIGIAFLARSGVGKTTHMTYWKEYLGDRMITVNGDKPLIRIIDGRVFAYGTPWAGKENINTNTKTELKKICFIERAEENSCSPVDKKDIIDRLMIQIYRPKSAEGLIKTLDYLEMMIDKVSFYIIRCNRDISAAKTAYEALMK